MNRVRNEEVPMRAEIGREYEVYQVEVDQEYEDSLDKWREWMSTIWLEWCSWRQQKECRYGVDRC